MRKNTGTFLFILLLAASGASSAFAQCSDSRINDAFRLALGRAPNAPAECDANRYAGRAFSTTTDLVPLVKASVVCQDPWIAQAYYRLGRQINGHDPTQPEMVNGRAQPSTRDQCNYTNYGSWPDFPALVRNVQNYFSQVSRAPAAPVGPAAQITSATIVMDQPAVVNWTYSGTPTTCGSGVYVRLNGGIGRGPFNWLPEPPRSPPALHILLTHPIRRLVCLCGMGAWLKPSRRPLPRPSRERRLPLRSLRFAPAIFWCRFR